MKCPQCHKPLTQVGSFSVCPDHGPVKPEAEQEQPNESKKARLFLSYGRRDAADLADRVRADLETRGYEVWQDTRQIRAGREWGQEIQDGLRSTQIVVALLSPHAVRVAHDPANPDNLDSVCLDEISFARFACNIPIIPVMGILCEPPLEIFRLDYVDLVAWQQSTDCYRVGFHRLVESLDAALRGETRYRKWDHRLRPWDFAPYLSEKREDFCGRQWLFDEIDRWRTTSNEPALLITGDPGVGKSAIVAELVHRNPGGQILAYHCCQADTPETLQPGRFVRSLAAMIASQSDTYAAMLDDPVIAKVLGEIACDTDPASALEAGILIPLQSFPAPEEGVRYVLVDALDEALLHKGNGRGSKNIVDVLASRLHRLPPWMRIIATTRNDPEVLAALSHLRARELNAKDPRNQADLACYIKNRLEAQPLAGELVRSELDEKTVAEVLQKKSDGNFLYVKQALNGIALGTYQLAQLHGLPPGLRGLYQAFFDRYFPNPNDFAVPESQNYTATRALLEVVVAAREPLTLCQLAAAARLDEHYQVPQLLRLLAVYLPDRQGCIRVFHKSFMDWLTDRKHAYYVNRQSGDRALAEVCRLAQHGSDEIDSSKYRAYGLRHGVHHFVEIGAFAAAVELLHFLSENPNLADHPGEAAFLTSARFLSVAIPGCSASEARRISPHKLAAVLIQIPSFEPVIPGIRLLYEYHSEDWHEIVDGFFGTANWWILMYACSFVLAEAYLKEQEEAKLLQICTWIRGSDYAYQDMGAYAVKMIYMRRPDLIDPKLLSELAGASTWMCPGIVGELLLFLAFNGHRPRELVASPEFWAPLWEYNRVLVEDILAAEAFAQGIKMLPDDVPEAIRRTHHFLLAIEGDRLKLLGSEEVKGDPSLYSLLESYYQLPSQLEKVRAAEDVIAKAMSFRPIMKLLLTNPYWEVRETAGSLAMTLAESRPEVLDLIAELLEDSNWRSQYAAMDLAEGVAHLDHDRSFFQAVGLLRDHPHSWLRGVGANCLVNWILRSNTEQPMARLRKVDSAVETLLRDEDAWALQEMHRLFHGLHVSGVNIAAYPFKEISPLLRNHPQWYQIGRNDFRRLLETEKPKQAAQNRVEAG